MDAIKEFKLLHPTEKLVDNAKALADNIPDFGEFDYFNLFPEFQEVSNEVNQTSLKIVQRILEYYMPLNTTVLKDNASLHESTQFSKIELLYDSIFEKLAEAIDMKKGLLIDTEENGAQKAVINRGNAATENVVKYSSSLNKPQLSFKDTIDNSSAPFQPQLKIKHNSKVEWNITEINEDGLYDNPYTYEISNIEYPAWQLQTPSEIIPPRPEKETPLIFVEEESQLKEAVEALKLESSIAVDLEHHDFRSYQGFTCLMQISTRTTDYLIDVIKIREFIWYLNEVFTNPAIMKVLHGADRDIVWLQKDFGVYMVNMFDSGQAARVLGFESFGLAYLLKRYCKVTANKEYQRADWRLRPLTKDMKRYAREDTHYLLYISDELRKLLVEQHLLTEVLKRSEALCKQSYQKPVVTIFSGEEVLAKKNLLFNQAQRHVFMILYYWRDQQARKLDESGQFILPIASLIKLAQMMPKSTSDLPRLLHPVPPEIRTNAAVLIELIRKGCEVPDGKEDTLLSVYHTVCSEKQEVKQEKQEKQEEAMEWMEEEEEEHLDVMKQLLQEGAARYPLAVQDTQQTLIPEHPRLFQTPKQSSHLSALAEEERILREKERLAKKRSVDEELDVEGMFRDLAMISGLMDHDESEDSEEEEEKKQEEKKQEEEEVMRSLKEAYKRQPAEPSQPSEHKRSRENDIDELLGVHEIELKTDEAMKKSIQWKSKKAKVEKKKAIQPEKMNQFIESIGAGNYILDQEELEKTQETLNKEKKKEKKKVMKKRFKEGRKQPKTL